MNIVLLISRDVVLLHDGLLHRSNEAGKARRSSALLPAEEKAMGILKSLDLHICRTFVDNCRILSCFKIFGNTAVNRCWPGVEGQVCFITKFLSSQRHGVQPWSRVVTPQQHACALDQSL